MGQAGAQREPSMEEILASIRRIIENNDPADAAEDTAAIDTASGDSIVSGSADHDVSPESSSDPETVVTPQSRAHELGDENAGNGMPTSNLANPEGHEADSSAVSQAEDASATPVSLADVAARVRGHSDHSFESSAARISEADRDAEAVIDDAIAAELRQALVSNEPVSAPQPSPEPVQSEEPEISQAPLTKTVEIAKDALEQPGAVNEPKPAAKSVQAVAPVASGTDDARGQLVSLHTGEKVAAAFNELTAAIEAGQARSFDDIAQDMLRPMLTQWLDDNLPTLVERLVREEIERVSRGDRR